VLLAPDRRSCGFDPIPMRFESRRQIERSSQLFERLVHGEAGRVRGDLEKNAAWFAVIDRVEIYPVDQRNETVIQTAKRTEAVELLHLIGSRHAM
jgi:hypothetical protein